MNIVQFVHGHGLVLRVFPFYCKLYSDREYPAFEYPAQLLEGPVSPENFDFRCKLHVLEVPMLYTV